VPDQTAPSLRGGVTTYDRTWSVKFIIGQMERRSQIYRTRVTCLSASNRIVGMANLAPTH